MPIPGSAGRIDSPLLVTLPTRQEVPSGCWQDPRLSVKAQQNTCLSFLLQKYHLSLVLPLQMHAAEVIVT